VAEGKPDIALAVPIDPRTAARESSRCSRVPVAPGDEARTWARSAISTAVWLRVSDRFHRWHSFCSATWQCGILSTRR
jgi:hypothetical protein